VRLSCGFAEVSVLTAVWPLWRDFAAAGGITMSQVNATSMAAVTMAGSATLMPPQGHLRTARRALKHNEAVKIPRCNKRRHTGGTF
jgi:hypothetical protein